jgi:hypothetical protein
MINNNKPDNLKESQIDLGELLPLNNLKGIEGLLNDRTPLRIRPLFIRLKVK